MARPSKSGDLYKETPEYSSLISYYLNLHQTGIELDQRGRNILIEAGFIHQPVYNDNAETTEQTGSFHISIEAVEKEFKDRKITKADWLAHDGNPLLPNEQFIEWVDSQLKGMSHCVYNRQYAIYKLQAKRWLADKRRFHDCQTPDDERRFIIRERNRCVTNSLYGLNRYLWMKEGEDESGELKYIAWENQAIVLWVLDCGFSTIMGKLRQTGFSTIMLARTEMRARLKKNFFIKFIAESKDKAEEIFDSKLKYAYTKQPEWFKPTVHNDTSRKFSYKKILEKGTITGGNSSVEVVAPTKTAINGGQPNEVLIDECGNIAILTSMLNEGRPALFWLNPETKEWEMKRQVTCFGTSGDMDKGKGNFEREYMAAVEAWKERDFRHGLVPIFIDCFSKPGITKEKYEEEKRFYYRKQRLPGDRTDPKIQFHQHYPASIEDMFLKSNETLIPIGEIVEHVNDIYRLPEDQQPMYGYMEPIYDQTIETPDLYFPYRVIGASFRPVRHDSEIATVIVRKPPQEGWRNRYFQGTDPISSTTGNSDMASGIKDSLANEIVAIMKHRTRDHQYCFAQATLLGIWYDPKIPELIESNIGQTYIDWKKLHRFTNIVRNDRLPKHMQVSTHGEGISKKSHNANYILNKTRELVEGGAIIEIPQFWLQMKTYVQKVSPIGYVSYATENPNMYRDDVIDGVTYSHICAEIYANRPPENIHETKAVDASKRKLRYRLNDRNELELDHGSRIKSDRF